MCRALEKHTITFHIQLVAKLSQDAKGTSAVCAINGQHSVNAINGQHSVRLYDSPFPSPLKVDAWCLSASRCVDELTLAGSSSIGARW